jgi:hypothetical protein
VQEWRRPELTVTTRAALAPAMPDEERRQAVKLAKLETDKIAGPASRAAALTALLPLLDESDQREYLARACDAAAAETETEERDAALAALLAVAPGALSQQAAHVTRAATAVTVCLTDLDSKLEVSLPDDGARQAYLYDLLTTPMAAQPADRLGALPPNQRTAIADRTKSALAAVDRLQAAADALASMTAVAEPGSDHATRLARARAVGQARTDVHILHQHLSKLGDNAGDTVLAAVRAADAAQLRLDGDLPQPQVSPRSGSPDPIPSPPSQADLSASWDARWRTVIQDVAPDGRGALLAVLSGLGPVIVRDGGGVAGQEAVQALLDAGRWWP